MSYRDHRYVFTVFNKLSLGLGTGTIMSPANQSVVRTLHSNIINNLNNNTHTKSVSNKLVSAVGASPRRASLSTLSSSSPNSFLLRPAAALLANTCGGGSGSGGIRSAIMSNEGAFKTEKLFYW
jgi:hypothetical protein